MQKINYKGKFYPKFQSEGFASRWAFPFAQELCKGEGVDIGYCKPEWKLPGAIGVDLGKMCSIVNDIEYTDYKKLSATNFPHFDLDYIFSSHCLEHLPDWVGVLNYWLSRIKYGGILFLYLPHPDQEYWKPWNNRKHINILHPDDLSRYFMDHDDVSFYKVTGKDLNDSFYAVAEKI